MWIFGGMVGAAALLGGTLPVKAQMGGAPTTVMSSRIIAEGTVEKVDHRARTMTLKLGTGEKLALNVSTQASEFEQIRRGDPVTVDYLQAVGVSLVPTSGTQGMATERSIYTSDRTVTERAAPEPSAAQQAQSASQAQAGAQQEPAERGATEAGVMMHAKPGSPSAAGSPGEGESEAASESFESMEFEQTYQVSAPGETPQETIVRVEELTAPIEAVDQQQRVITLRGPDGLMRLYVAPEAGSLASLQPGSRIMTRYTKALALDVRKSEAE
jgi:hypothetical protein